MRLRVTLLFAALLVAVTAFAQRLPNTVVPNHYDLAFTPDFPSWTYEGDETIDVVVAAPVSEIVLHAITIEFTEVTVTAGGVTQQGTVRLEPENFWARISVPRAIPPGPASIHIRFKGQLNEKLRGFYRGESNGRRYASTQLESTDARRAFPCFDEPDLKATFAIRAVVDEGQRAISNGEIVADEPGPAAGKHTIRFATTRRISTYLVALTVGDFDCTKGEIGGVPLGICGTPDKLPLGGFAMDATKFVVPWYENYFGIAYPFGKLDQTGIADFQAGAMENPGQILYRETALFLDPARASGGDRRDVSGVIAHEIAHMWFGDLVTMRWWDDIWLNEGFASWVEGKPIAAWKPEWKIPLREIAYTGDVLASDSLETSRQIRKEATTPAEIDALFDGIAYGKTAAVLQMIESYIGEDAMRRGIGAYLSAHSWGNATYHDFSEALAAASNDPKVTDILRTYVEQPGVPVLRASSSCENGETLLTVEQQRYFSSPAAKPSGQLWSVPLCWTAGGTRRCEIVSQPKQTLRIAGCAPVVLNAGGTGYYVSEPSGAMLDALVASPANLSSAERLVLLRDEWSLVQSGRRGVDQYLKLADAFRADTEPLVVMQATEPFSVIRRHIAADADRAAFESWVRAWLQPLAKELGWTPKPGEDEDRRALRANVLRTLGLVGRDRQAMQQARKLIEKDIAGKANLDPELREAVTVLAAAGGDAKLYEVYRAQIAKAATPTDRYRFMGALPFFSDPKLTARTLDFALSPGFRTQDLWTLGSIVWANPDGPKVPWGLIEQNWARVEERVPETMRGGVLGVAGAFCDPESLAHVREFYAAHGSEWAARSTAMALDRITQCIAIHDLQSPKLHQFLAK